MKIKVKSVKVKLNQSAIRKLTRAEERAAELTAEAILSDIVSRAVTPKDTGELERSGFVEKSRSLVYSIVFSTPYARRWYFNLPITDVNGRKSSSATFQKTKNVNAQDHWMDYYFTGEGMQWIIDTYTKFLKQESGGVVS